MSATLVLIDMQKAVDDAGMAKIRGMRGQPAAEEKAAALLAHWRESGQPIVHIQNHSMDPDAADAPGKPGHAFIPALKPQSHEPVVEKRGDNAFVGTDLMAVLEDAGPAELVVCGMTLENSVESTIRMAHALGFMVFLAADCCASRPRVSPDGQTWSSDTIHAVTLSVLDGDYAKIVTSGDLMAGAAQTKLH
ncbi:MAG: isochorismatase family protein [Pseudomonadota bacterium]